MSKFAYFIAGPFNLNLGLEYSCTVIEDGTYKTIFQQWLSEEDKVEFEKIMKEDKYALLNKNHPRLGELAIWKIDNHKKKEIRNKLD